MSYMPQTTYMTRVAGKDASSADLVYLTEEDIETVCGAMTNVEKTRLSAALQALRDKRKMKPPILE
eukprot:COSAG02_NODE_4655_length_5128_cov_2.384569_4_plen_66_part_00